MATDLIKPLQRCFCFRIKFDSRNPTLIFPTPMAEVPTNNPMPGAPQGAEPLKKSTGKVQPKKETVRINLPPKPTAAPTIKLPTLPPGGPTGAPSVAPAAVAPPSAAAPALTRVASAPAAAPAAKGAAPTATQRPASVAPRTVVVPSIKALDKILIVGAFVASLIGAGLVFWSFWTLKNFVDNPPV
jgi:hypothetical protein